MAEITKEQYRQNLKRNIQLVGKDSKYVQDVVIPRIPEDIRKELIEELM